MFNIGSQMPSSRSDLEATYIIEAEHDLPGRHVEHYAGTLGNFNLTAGSARSAGAATGRTRSTWGPASLTATAYYTSGYNYSAEDQRTACAGDCSLVPVKNLDNAAYQACNVKSFISVDLHGRLRSTIASPLCGCAERRQSQGPDRRDHLWCLSLQPGRCRGRHCRPLVPRRREGGFLRSRVTERAASPGAARGDEPFRANEF